MLEAQAYPQLYQESAGRKTKDKGISILQGRCVGGSTTVNWTSSFRTPPATLEYWQRNFGLTELTVAELAPWFAMMERRLDIAAWTTAPNANNDALRRGAERLGIATGTMRRNVTGCWNLGYCGLGCPTQAKQSMLVTTIPAALSQGGVLVSSRTRTAADDREGRCHGTGMRGVGCERPAAGTAQGHGHRPPLRACSRRHRQSCAAVAQPGARPVQADRAAHFPASHVRVRRRHAGAGGRLRRRAAERLLGPFPGDRPDRRPGRLQAGGAAAAPAAHGYDPARLRRIPRPADATDALHPGDHRADAGRLPRAQPGRNGRAQVRRLAAARLSAHRFSLGRHASRALEHGADPVRGRREGGRAGARAGRCLLELGGGEGGDRTSAHGAAQGAGGECARDGRLRAWAATRRPPW